MTAEARRARAKLLRRKLAIRVGEICSTGLGLWEPYIDIVEAPQDRFEDLVAEWVERGDDATRAELEVATRLVLDAYREADIKFREARGMGAREGAAAR